MKKKAMTYLNLLLLMVVMVNLTACEVEINPPYEGDSRKTLDLCSRTWVDEYYDSDGNENRQELDFYADRTGVDYIRTVYPDGGVYQNEYPFRWSWTDNKETTLRMVYGPNDVSTLYDAWIRGNALSGYLDDWDNYVDYIGR